LDRFATIRTCPKSQALWATRPHTFIHSEGRHVGLPDGQMGNPEGGHTNLGAAAT
jgi:2,3-bisphosphoglycerate-independent phosphoglycerate mutase